MVSVECAWCQYGTALQSVLLHNYCAIQSAEWMWSRWDIMKTETKTKQAVLKEFILTFCMVIDYCSDGLTPASQCSEAWGGDPYIKPSFFSHVDRDYRLHKFCQSGTDIATARTLNPMAFMSHTNREEGVKEERAKSESASAVRVTLMTQGFLSHCKTERWLKAFHSPLLHVVRFGMMQVLGWMYNTLLLPSVKRTTTSWYWC